MASRSSLQAVAIATWQTHDHRDGWRSQLYPYNHKWQTEQVMMPQDTIDTIHHDVLLWKLNNFIGIRGLPLKLLVSYLQARQQYTVIDGCTSATLNIIQGVPQGSSLGPLLIALYINDLPSTTKPTPTLFADDTVLSISGSNSYTLTSCPWTIRKPHTWL